VKHGSIREKTKHADMHKDEQTDIYTQTRMQTDRHMHSGRQAGRVAETHT